jgi:hypothetical protein
MTVPSAAEDPGRYHPQSTIRQYLAAKATAAPAEDLLPPAVHERWSVKTGADADAQALTNQAPTSTTIAQLTALPVPGFLPPDGRSDGAEKTVYQLTATLQAFGREADGDYHMVIADDQGTTMIAEIPDPSDITAPSFFAAQIANARTAFDNKFQVVENIAAPAAPGLMATGFQEVSVPVTLTGIGYFDFKHGQRGVADNAIELHPVINIAFNG